MAKDKSKKSKVEAEVEVKTKKSKKADAAEPIVEKKSKKEKAGKPAKSSKHVDIDPNELDVDDPHSGYWKFNEEALGELVVITPRKIIPSPAPEVSSDDVIEADVIVVNTRKPEKSQVELGVVIFGKVLFGALRPSVGKGRIVGRLVMGEKKGGKSAPYILEKADDDERAAAIAAIKATK